MLFELLVLQLLVFHSQFFILIFQAIKFFAKSFIFIHDFAGHLVLAAVFCAQFFSPFAEFDDLFLFLFDIRKVGIIILSKLFDLSIQCPDLGAAVSAVFVIAQYLIIQFADFLLILLLKEFRLGFILIKISHLVAEFLVIVILHFQFLVENLHLHFFFKHAILQLVLFCIRLGNPLI